MSKHILFVSSWYPVDYNDKSGVFIVEQASALVRAGYKVGVISLNSFSVRKLTVPEYKHSEESKIKILRLLCNNYFPFSEKLTVALIKKRALSLFHEYVRLNGYPDVLHSHSAIFGGIMAMHISKITKLPYIHTEHSSGFIRKLHSTYLTSYAENVMNNSSKPIFVSDFLLKLFKDRLKIEPAIISNFVNPDFFEHKEIKKYKSDEKLFTFIHISLLNKNKGVYEIISAFSKVINLGIKAKLIIIGGGPELERLIRFSIELNLSDSILFTGLLDRHEIITYLDNSDCFISNSEFETFGIVCAEAICRGVSVISSPSGGPEGFITNKVGKISDSNSSDALYLTMKYMIENNSYFNKDEIRKYGFSMFSEKSFINSISEIYDKV